MTNIEKFWKALFIIKSEVECTIYGDVNSQEDFDKIEWNNGVDKDNNLITTLVNPHSELTWTIVNNKMIELQTAYDGVGLVQRNRAKEYPSIVDQLDDIYHNGIDSWKSTIKVTKDKYPKG